MSDIYADPETLRRSSRTVRESVRAIKRVSDGIDRTIKGSSGWSDSQGEEFRNVLSRVKRLVDSPLETLEAAPPKIDRLADALDEYQRIRF